MSKIIIGTANFNKPYGRKQILADGNEIIQAARQLGINTLDVSPNYGDYGERGWGDFEFIYKVATIEHIERALSLPNTYAIIAHGYEAWQRLGHVMSNIVPPNIKIGASLYHPEEVNSDLPSILQIVEIPVNMVDQRWVPLLPYFRLRRTEVIARSLFLHGTLFETSWKGYPLALYSYNLVRMNPGIDRIIVGVDNAEQLIQLANYPELEVDYEHLSNNRSKKWLNPITKQDLPLFGEKDSSRSSAGTDDAKQADLSGCGSDNTGERGQGDHTDSPEQ